MICKKENLLTMVFLGLILIAIIDIIIIVIMVNNQSKEIETLRRNKVTVSNVHKNGKITIEVKDSLKGRFN